MKTKSLIIHIALIIISGVGFYFFYFNSQLLISYESNNSEIVHGKLEFYNIDKSGRTPYFTLKLKEFANLFAVPIPEWKSFDSQSFKELVGKNDSIFISVPSGSKLNNGSISAFQIKSNKKNFITLDKKIMLRKIEKWLALTFGIFGLIGSYFHYKNPWI